MSSAAPALIQVAPGQSQLQGEITLHNVTALIETGRQQISASQNSWTLDLSAQSGTFSSAAVALLLDWLRQCEASGKTLQLTHPPAQFGAMITICGLDDIFTPLIASA